MVYFTGAGPGDRELLTLKASRLIGEADVIIYAGSLIDPGILEGRKKECILCDSAYMDLSEITDIMKDADLKGQMVVRLCCGDPGLYSAVREQMDILDEAGIDYETVPGVSAFQAAAAAMNREYTLPGVSQSLVITRVSGKTAVPDRESVEMMASHGGSMVFFLSSSLGKEAEKGLLKGGYDPATPAAVVYRASWPDQKIYRCTVGTLAETISLHNITKHALLMVGDFLSDEKAECSKLYDPSFETEYRKPGDLGKTTEKDRNDGN